MIIETLSTFPHMYDSVMGESIMKRAQQKGALTFKAHDLRDYTHDRHRTTDDSPYGGGAGLVMKCEPIFEAVDDICGGVNGYAQCASTQLETVCAAGKDSSRTGETCLNAEISSSAETSPNAPARPKIVFLAPQGRTFTDAFADELAAEERLLFICGHYEGIDERVYSLADYTISLGDYVLTSGELASMVVIDAVVRKLPGVLGAETGAIDESFTSGLLEYPQYTRPASFRGMDVPDVLLSGNHAAINTWRREQSLLRTAQLRPDLMQSFEEQGHLTPADRKFLSMREPAE